MSVSEAHVEVIFSSPETLTLPVVLVVAGSGKSDYSCDEQRREEGT